MTNEQVVNILIEAIARTTEGSAQYTSSTGNYVRELKMLLDGCYVPANDKLEESKYDIVCPVCGGPLVPYVGIPGGMGIQCEKCKTDFRPHAEVAITTAEYSTPEPERRLTRKERRQKSKKMERPAPWPPPPDESAPAPEPEGEAEGIQELRRLSELRGESPETGTSSNGTGVITGDTHDSAAPAGGEGELKRMKGNFDYFPHSSANTTPPPTGEGEGPLTMTEKEQERPKQTPDNRRIVYEMPFGSDEWYGQDEAGSWYYRSQFSQWVRFHNSMGERLLDHIRAQAEQIRLMEEGLKRLSKIMHGRHSVTKLAEYILTQLDAARQEGGE